MFRRIRSQESTQEILLITHLIYNSLAFNTLIENRRNIEALSTIAGLSLFLHPYFRVLFFFYTGFPGVGIS